MIQTKTPIYPSLYKDIISRLVVGNSDTQATKRQGMTRKKINGQAYDAVRSLPDFYTMESYSAPITGYSKFLPAR